MKHFRPHEFQCCCRYECGNGFAQMNPDFLDRLEMARIYADEPFLMNSAYRCRRHNRDVGGSENSAHTHGLAVDIKTPNSHMRYSILYGLIKAGFKRIGIYSSFIHVDDDLSKALEVCWYGD